MSKIFQVNGIRDNYWFGTNATIFGKNLWIFLAKIVLNTVKIYDPWGRRKEIKTFFEHV